MKIEHNEPDITIPFDMLKSGDVFVYEGEIIMKVDCVLPAARKHEINAIHLKSGTWNRLEPNDPVIALPNAKCTY